MKKKKNLLAQKENLLARLNFWWPRALGRHLMRRLTTDSGFYGHSPTKYMYVQTQWCKQDKMSWIKNVWYFPIISKLIQKLLYNIVLAPFISHSVIYILGGPIASFIPQVYNYVRKYVFLVQHHMYSLAVNTSFDLLVSLSCCAVTMLQLAMGVATFVAICPREIGCHTYTLQYIHWKLPPILPLPTVKYIIVHWSFLQQYNEIAIWGWQTPQLPRPERP